MSQRNQTLQKLENDSNSLLAETQAELGAKPRIAAWGLVKAGKSSLLNMLAGHITDEYFKTGVVRTTRTNSELETDNYILVDTPGLGIDENDSAQAFKGLDSADVILFVHSPQGELDQEEIDLLTQIKAAYAYEAEQRLILVISQLDKDQNGSTDAIAKRINEQLQEYIGIQPACFKISNTRYQKGIAQNKSSMAQKSGIPNLAQHLDTLSLEISSQLDSVRNSRQQARKTQLLKEIDQAIEAELQLLSSQKKPYIKAIETFNQMMAQLREEFSSHNAEIQAAQKKLNSI